MDILRKNAEITQSYMVQLEQLNASYAIEREKINEEIVAKSSAYLEESCDDVHRKLGHYHQQLNILKIKYDHIIHKENEDTMRLMTEYQSKLSMVSTKDIEKLRI